MGFSFLPAFFLDIHEGASGALSIAIRIVVFILCGSVSIFFEELFGLSFLIEIYYADFDSLVPSLLFADPVSIAIGSVGLFSLS